LRASARRRKGLWENQNGTGKDLPNSINRHHSKLLRNMVGTGASGDVHPRDAERVLIRLRMRRTSDKTAMQWSGGGIERAVHG
jgi:hypothetical protein